MEWKSWTKMISKSREWRKMNWNVFQDENNVPIVKIQWKSWIEMTSSFQFNFFTEFSQ